MTIATFDNKPKTVSFGGQLKGRHIVWVNFSVKEIGGDEPHWEGMNERLAIGERSLDAFLSTISEDMLAIIDEDEVLEVMQAFDAVDDLQSWVAMRTAQVNAYDQSSSVNSFILNGNEGWLDKSTRVGLVNMYQLLNDTDSVPSIWMNGSEVAMESATEALNALRQIEIYASQCYTATQKNLSEIAILETNEDIGALKAFDLTVAYPCQIKIGE